VKFRLMGGKRTLSKAFSQTLRLEAAKTAAGLLVRLHVVRSGVPLGPQGPSAAGLGDLYAGSVGVSAILRETSNRDGPRRMSTGTQEMNRVQCQEGTGAINPSH
jgi:hypothetical protein